MPQGNSIGETIKRNQKAGIANPELSDLFKDNNSNKHLLLTQSKAREEATFANLLREYPGAVDSINNYADWYHRLCRFDEEVNKPWDLKKYDLNYMQSLYNERKKMGEELLSDCKAKLKKLEVSINFKKEKEEASENIKERHDPTNYNS